MSGIKENREVISNLLTDRCRFVDSFKKSLHTGDMCIIHNPDRLSNHFHRIPKNQLIQKVFALGVFVRLPNSDQCKFIIATNEFNPIIRTLHEKDYRRVTKDFQKDFQLSVIIGDYSQMDEEWKKTFFYNELVQFSKKFIENLEK